jgi:hypothetical protein
MSEIDYAELFQSPLDDEPGGRGGRWGPIAGGLIAGVLVVGGIAMIDGSDEIVPATTTIAPTTTTIAASVPEELSYPPGFTEIAPELAAQPYELIRQDDSLLVAFHTAVRRDTDPGDVAWPIGGSWWLGGADDSGIEASRVVLGRSSPGGFAVEFPRLGDGGEAGVSTVRMIERWDLETESGVEQIPFDGEPFEMPQALAIPISDSVTLVIDQLQLGSFIGRVSWRLDGGDEPIGRVLVEVTLLGAAGEEVGSYRAFPVILDPDVDGIIEIFWQEPFPEDQEGAVIAEVRYSVGLVDVVATDVEFQLQGVPEGR